jgi:hypothetical protein
VNQIVTWILSLANKTALKKSMPPAGSIVPPGNEPPNTAMVISASYTDKGGNNIKALTGKTTVSLRSSTVYFTGLEKVKGFVSFKYNGQQVMILPAKAGWMASELVDLTGVRRIDLSCGWQTPPNGSLDFEIRLDGPDGRLLGKGGVPAPGRKGQSFGVASIPVGAVTDGAMHSVYVLYSAKEPVTGGIQYIQFNSK